jgi:hypothetical protein
MRGWRAIAEVLENSRLKPLRPDLLWVPSDFGRDFPGSLLKKPSLGFPTSPNEKCDFHLAHIFNGLQPSKMAVHPCTARSLSKKGLFQQAAGLAPTSICQPENARQSRQSPPITWIIFRMCVQHPPNPRIAPRRSVVSAALHRLDCP